MRATTLRFLIPSLILATTAVATAAPHPTGANSWCGSHPTGLVIDLARHEAFERHLERERAAGRLLEKSAPNVVQQGHVAVIEDDGTLAIGPSFFDLADTQMQYLRRPRGMAVTRSALDFKDLIGSKIDLGDDTSGRLDFPPGFRFPIGDEVFDSVWVNSDGNLTFGVPEPFSPRSLASFLNGPPRIAPLYTDLDPSAAEGENGVYVNFLGQRIRITWLGVPEFGADNLNTFQVTLFSNGRVNFAYGADVDTTSAVVGVAPFGDLELNVVDYDQELPIPVGRTAVAEVFTNSVQIDFAGITNAFFEHFKDRYEFVAVFEDFPISLGGAFAFAFTVKNNERGFGQSRFDASGIYGSNGRLEQILQMGRINRFSADPDEIVLRTYTSMGVLAHEAGHRWLSFVGYDETGTGAPTGRLLGAGNAHWSHHLDTDGSLMEGNDYDDNGDGTFTITGGTTSHFSALDQYLMGLVPPAQVPDFFYIDNPTAFQQDDVTQAARIGTQVGGDRVDASVERIIAVEGERTPGPGNSRKAFRTAFVLLVRQGEQASQESIDLLEAMRQQYSGFFAQVTDGRATMRTALFPR